MELDLKNFSTTLAVGVFVVCVSLLCVRLFWISGLTRWAKMIAGWGTVGQAVVGLFFVLTVFGCGIVGETVSNRFADANYGEWHERLLPTEKEMRADTLFGTADERPALAYALASTGRISRHVLDREHQAIAGQLEDHLNATPKVSRQSLETWLHKEFQLKDKPSKTLESLTASLYYPAKNTLIGHDNIAQELWTIQKRLDFCRSIAVYSAFFFGLGVVAFFLSCMVPAIVLRNPVPWQYKTAFLAVMTLIFLFTRACYKSEEREYDMRVFGYYATLPDADLPDIARVARPEPTDCSGALRLPNNKRVLVVRDAKPGVSPSPLRVATVHLENGRTQNVDVQWPEGAPLASDLEAVCPVPDSPDLLLCESGYYKGQYGRVFRCTPAFPDQDTSGQPSLKVTATWQWPAGMEDLEGVACVKAGGQHWIIAAERKGVLRWCPVPAADAATPATLLWQGELTLSQAFLAPYAERKVSDLHVTASGEVWASATFEPEETGAGQGHGPFRSMVYQLGTLISTGAQPEIKVEARPRHLIVEGFKVEALAAGLLPNQWFIGTDDEDFGGVWRLLDASTATTTGSGSGSP